MVVALVWGIAVLIGIVVLGLCAFDLAGKAQRLRKDADRLQDLQSRLTALQDEVADAQRRLPDRRPA